MGGLKFNISGQKVGSLTPVPGIPLTTESLDNKVHLSVLTLNRIQGSFPETTALFQLLQEYQAPFSCGCLGESKARKGLSPIPAHIVVPHGQRSQTSGFSSEEAGCLDRGTQNMLSGSKYSTGCFLSCHSAPFHPFLPCLSVCTCLKPIPHDPFSHWPLMLSLGPLRLSLLEFL